MPRTTKRSARRAGFTMVEMLVVVTIIAILLSLTTAAVLRLIPAQQAINTKSSLTRFDDDLVRAYRSAADKVRHEPIPTGGPMLAAYQNVYSVAGNDRGRAQVIWTKLRLRQTFPNNFAEAWNYQNTLTPLPALSYYKTKLAALGYTDPNMLAHMLAGPYQWESSVCLLWALQRGEDSQALKESDFGTGSLKDFGQTPLIASNPSSGQTPNQQPVKGLIDDWGTPLNFMRWPVNSTQLNPTGAQLGDKNDSDDPSGLLEATNWQTTGAAFSANANQFMAWCHPLALHLANTEAKTFRIFPLIVSAGPDKKLGLDTSMPPPPPTGAGYFATLPTTDAADNIYPALASPK
jgi:prepilin-type N-terminal cleavage/methylation domain-containing protein